MLATIVGGLLGFLLLALLVFTTFWHPAWLALPVLGALIGLARGDEGIKALARVVSLAG